MTRRAFVGAVAAGTAGLAAAVRALRRSYRIGLETWCFHDVDLETMVTHVASLGIRDLELHEDHLPRDSSPARIASAQRVMRDAGLTPVGVYIHNAYRPDEAVTRPILEFVRAGGFTYVTGEPSRESLPTLNRLAPEYGIQVAIHNHGPGAPYETLQDVTAALDAHGHLRAVIDIGHFARSGVDPVEATRQLGRRAVAVHVKDVDVKGRNVVVGEGRIDMPGVFRALRESAFDGLLVLEYEGDFDNMERRLAGMKKSLANMQRFIEAAQQA